MTHHVEDELKAMKKKSKKKKTIHDVPDSQFLSTGVDLLDIAFTGRLGCGYRLGRYVNYPGTSDSGKTVLCFTSFAEAAKDPRFDHYDFYYDPAEGSSPPPIKKLFGSKVKERLQILEPSETVEDFHERFEDLTAKGTKSCVYVLDSSDALSCRAGDKADDAGKGNMGTGIAKAWAKGFRKTDKYLRSSKSILTIISQTRKNIGIGAMFNPDVRSGGNALKFYARIEMWLKTVKEEKGAGRKDWIIGQVAKAKITKNHLSGWKGWVLFNLAPDTGIDNLRSNVNWLVEEGVWPIKKKVINAKELDIQAKIDPLIQQIEFADQEDTVRQLVLQRWKDIAASLNIKRKKRYT